MSNTIYSTLDSRLSEIPCPCAVSEEPMRRVEFFTFKKVTKHEADIYLQKLPTFMRPSRVPMEAKEEL